jgi:hypothetical protein
VTVRPGVRDFVNLGPLPDSGASVDMIAKHEEYLARIERPVTDEEAELLVRCFGPDDCFGLAHALTTLVETAPEGTPIKEKPAETENEWIIRLWERANFSESE